MADATPTTSKRKLDDLIFALDDAVRVRPERPPPPQRQNLSIYATLAKYGIPTSTKNLKRRKIVPKATPAIIKPSDTNLNALYRPSSLPALLSRLATFKLSTYSSKPEPLDALAAARAGWTNEGPGKDRLVCLLCKASWVVATSSNAAERDRLVERQVPMLKEVHGEGCLWRVRGCDESLYAVPLSSPAQLIGDIIASSRELDALLKDVVIKNPLTDEQLVGLNAVITSYAEKEKKRLQRDNPQPESEPQAQNVITSPPSMNALLTSLFGWEPVLATPPAPTLLRSTSTRSISNSVAGSRASTPAPNSTSPTKAGSPLKTTPAIARPTHSRAASVISLTNLSPMDVDTPLTPQNTLLQCAMCHRRIPLWAHVASGNAQDKPPKPLDLLKEHRPTCAYVTRTSSIPSLKNGGDADSDLAEEKVMGWEGRVDTVLRFGRGDLARRSAYQLGGGIEGSRVGLGGKNGSKEVLGYLRRLLG